MQAGELLSLSSSSTATATATATLNPEDCGANTMLGISASFGNGSVAEQMESELKSLSLELEEKLEVDDGDEDEEEEFSFVCANPDGSPISADDAFHNGQIRPMYPLFNRDLLFEEDSETRDKAPSPLRKVFVESKGVVEGTYCEWSPATAESSPKLVNKSNSTGFSKLWRFRDLMTMHRSSSDGKDAFVFLNNPTTPKSPAAAANNPHHSQKHLKPPTPSSPHHTHYVSTSRAHKRRSYLPYRQDLLGFFTTVNGFSKNVHPF